MKKQLDKQQSEHLISLGVPKEKASMIEHTLLTDTNGNPIDDNYKKTFTWRFLNEKPYKPFKAAFSKTSYAEQDIFTLYNLLEILPKEIEQDYCDDFCIKYSKGRYYAGYGFNEPYEGFGFGKFYTAEDLIDALYELCVWCLENKYLKFE